MQRRTMARRAVGSMGQLFFAMWVVAITASGCSIVQAQLPFDSMDPQTIDIDKFSDDITNELVRRGVLPPGVDFIPEVWPASLPDVKYSSPLKTSPYRIDLSPDTITPGSSDELIKVLTDAVYRVELNRVVVRVEQNTANIPIPEMSIQVADDKDADPSDFSAWQTVGIFPGIEAETVGDVDLEWKPGGQGFFAGQLLDDKKEMAVRIDGSLEIDTQKHNERPRGVLSVRFIVVTTVYVDTGAIDYKYLLDKI